MSLEITGVSKKFNKNEGSTLEDVNLSINEGEFICLLGSSGCGKSTLLNIIAGLLKADTGKLYLDGEEILGVGPERAVMFQESALFPWLKVIENVEFGMKMAKVPKEERRERARLFLKMVHLSKFENKYVHELSGGMKQRVALARALTLNSKVLLMDEPFSALDSQIRSILQTEIQRIWLQTKKTIVFVTHDVEEAVLLADRVIVLSANPGKVKKDIKIELSRPRSMEDIDVAYYMKLVLKELREEVEKIAKSEYDSDWNFEEDTVLSGTDTTMGIGL